MVRREDDHSVLHQAFLLHPFKQTAHMIVDLLYQSHVGWDNRLAHFFSTDSFTYPTVLIGAENGVISLPLVLGSNGWRYIVRPKHRGIGLWYDIGPMRFDET